MNRERKTKEERERRSWREVRKGRRHGQSGRRRQHSETELKPGTIWLYLPRRSTRLDDGVSCVRCERARQAVREMVTFGRGHMHALHHRVSFVVRAFCAASGSRSDIASQIMARYSTVFTMRFYSFATGKTKFAQVAGTTRAG